jgi:hypothetical protein
MGIEPMYRALQPRDVHRERPAQSDRRRCVLVSMGTVWERDRAA